MTHYGIVSEPIPGHLNRLMTIGRQLQRSGHRVTVFGIADLEPSIERNDLEFCAIGVDDFPPGSLEQRWLSPRQSQGPLALAASVRVHTAETEMLCRDVPDQVRKHDVDVLLVDQLQVAGRYIAEATDRPFVTVCAGPGLLRVADRTFPPPFVTWAPSSAPLTKVMNRVAFGGIDLVAGPRLRVANRYARRDGLCTYRSIFDTSSPLLQISSLVPEMNFAFEPPASMPFCYFGPLIDDRRASTPFPWERLNGKPLIYASLGTLQKGNHGLYGVIATACAGLDAQLVITSGDVQSVSQLMDLPGDPVVVGYAPQLDLLGRAALCITHCGVNTTMESVAHGVPLVGIPILYDQPAVAARIRHAGVGVTVRRSRLTADRLRDAVSLVLDDSSYRQRAQKIAATCRSFGGAVGAADAIEQLS